MPKLLTRGQVVAEAKKAGFTGIKTLAGEVSLDDWKPYGKTEHKTIGFYIDGSQIKERPLNDACLKSRMLAGEVRKLGDQFVFGVWELTSTSVIAVKIPRTREEYAAYEHARQEIISRNRSRRIRGLSILPTPPKLEPPKVRVAYEPDGTYMGRLPDNPEDDPELPEGTVIKLEAA
jgi:hypothetical protein